MRISIKNNTYFCNNLSELTGDFTNDFDAIFSYLSLPLTPFLETIELFNLMLKPKGRLYLNCYDLGWMIYNIENNNVDRLGKIQTGLENDIMGIKVDANGSIWIVCKNSHELYQLTTGLMGDVNSDLDINMIDSELTLTKKPLM